jgi:hypothetical protein
MDDKVNVRMLELAQNFRKSQQFSFKAKRKKIKKIEISVEPDALPHVAVIMAAVHRGHTWPPGQASPPLSQERLGNGPPFSLGLFSVHRSLTHSASGRIFPGLPDFSIELVLSCSLHVLPSSPLAEAIWPG